MKKLDKDEGRKNTKNKLNIKHYSSKDYKKYKLKVSKVKNNIDEIGRAHV